MLRESRFGIKNLLRSEKKQKRIRFASFSSAQAKKIVSLFHFFSPGLHQIFHSASVFISFKAKHKKPFFASKEKNR
jgi:hypothetical protein